MSTTTDGIICFGIMFEEGYEFPWEDYCENEWWEEKNDSEPFPFELVNYCSGDCEMWILAIKGTVITANRGYPESFDPKALTVTDVQIKKLTDFCLEYDLEFIRIVNPQYPQWYLCSYWG